MWKDIVGYEGLYQVSDEGFVRSLDRVIITKQNRRMFKKGIILKPECCKSTGYMYINLNKNGKPKHCTVHRLVAQAFIPNPENFDFVNHIDEDKTNNRADNLEWINNINNLKYSDAWRKGVNNRRDYNGENNPFYGKHHSEETRKHISEVCKQTAKKGWETRRRNATKKISDQILQ